MAAFVGDLEVWKLLTSLLPEDGLPHLLEDVEGWTLLNILCLGPRSRPKWRLLFEVHGTAGEGQGQGQQDSAAPWQQVRAVML